MSPVLILLISLLGVCYGSFLNVLIVRTISGESIITPFSKCPKCGHALYWWHNIPILSYFLLKGKCYFCNKIISIQYPIIEFGTLVLTWFSFNRYVSLYDAISVIAIISLFFVQALTDIKIQKISTKISVIIVLFGVIFNRYDIINSLSGLIIAGGTVSFLIILGRYLLKRDIFGAGDIFIAMSFGAVIGYEKIMIFSLYVLILQFLFILPKYVKDLIKFKQAITLKYLIIFCIACLYLYVSKNVYLTGTTLVSVLFWGIIMYSAYKLVINLVHNINSDECVSYTPIAPSVAIITLLFLF